MPPTHFDPRNDVTNGHTLIRSNGEWPNFHDAQVHRLYFDRGDMRPEDDVWIGAWLLAELETWAEEKPERILLKFHDVDEVNLEGFNHSNDIYDLHFTTEPRGTYADGKTPLQPATRVRFARGFGVDLNLRCMHVEVLPDWPF